jgi:23S rRNA maturation mini-RNase III
MTALVESSKSISFEEAWRKFLLVRPFTNQIMLTYVKDAQQKIVRVDTGPVQIMWDDQQRWLIDSVSIPGVLLGFPEEIVKKELETKVFSKMINKVITEEELARMKRKVSEHLEKGGRRLGCANMKELAEEISGGNYWEALFSLHQLIEYRLRMLILYKSGKLDAEKSQVILDPLKQKLLSNIGSFKHLVDLAFIMDAVFDVERTKIMSFKSERDTLAHDLLTKEMEASMLQTMCKHGLEVVEMLQDALSRTIPKPAIITVKKFEMQELPL